MFTETECAKIKELKAKIGAMLKERHLLEAKDNGFVAPSKYWSDFCTRFEYLFGLEERFFEQIRQHTYHLTYDNYLTYYFGNAEEFRKNLPMDALTANLPKKLILNEPAGGIGFSFPDGRFVSYDVLRYQEVVNHLFHNGIFDSLERRNGIGGNPIRILEIGGGYGGLAHHISKIVPKSTYFLLDLPETLLFSASYLSLLNPNKRLYLYEPKSFRRTIEEDDIHAYDFVLLPNYRLESLRRFSFDLVLNVESFQEMRVAQLETYLEFIRQTCRGILYSSNQDRQPRNSESFNLTALLKQRFTLTPLKNPGEKPARLKKTAKQIAILLGLWESNTQPAINNPELKYICKPIL